MKARERQMKRRRIESALDLESIDQHRKQMDALGTPLDVAQERNAPIGRIVLCKIAEISDLFREKQYQRSVSAFERDQAEALTAIEHGRATMSQIRSAGNQGVGSVIDATQFFKK